MNLLDFAKYLYRRPQHLIIQAFSSLFSKGLNIEEWDNVLVISPHPDDEVFGCGGLIEALAKWRKKIKIVYLSKGESALPHDKYKKEDIVDVRRQLAIEANKMLGLTESNLEFLDFPDGEFQSASESQMKKLQLVIEQFNPQYILYPHPYDGSPDHTVATHVVNRILESKKDIERYYYCVWLWHHMPFYKSFILDYKNSYYMKYNWRLKKEAMDIYTESKSVNGDFYSGELPPMLLKAITWEKELYFKVR